jgi:hypothetical protein
VLLTGKLRDIQLLSSTSLQRGDIHEPEMIAAVLTVSEKTVETVALSMASPEHLA